MKLLESSDEKKMDLQGDKEMLHTLPAFDCKNYDNKLLAQCGMPSREDRMYIMEDETGGDTEDARTNNSNDQKSSDKTNSTKAGFMSDPVLKYGGGGLLLLGIGYWAKNKLT